LYQIEKKDQCSLIFCINRAIRKGEKSEKTIITHWCFNPNMHGGVFVSGCKQWAIWPSGEIARLDLLKKFEFPDLHGGLGRGEWSLSELTNTLVLKDPCPSQLGMCYFSVKCPCNLLLALSLWTKLKWL